MGLNHFTIFVAFNEDPNLSDEDHLYLVDVGFGGANITVPLPICKHFFQELVRRDKSKPIFP